MIRHEGSLVVNERTHRLDVGAGVDAEDGLFFREFAGEVVAHLLRCGQGEFLTGDDTLGIGGGVGHVAPHPVDACFRGPHGIEVEMRVAVVQEVAHIVVGARVVHLAFLGGKQAFGLVEVAQDEVIDFAHGVERLHGVGIRGHVGDALGRLVGRGEEAQQVEMQEGTQAEHLAAVVVMQGEVGAFVQVGEDVVDVADDGILLAPHVCDDGLHFIGLVVILRQRLGELGFVFVAAQVGGQHFGESPVHVASVGVFVLQFSVHAVDGVFEALGVLELVVLHPFALGAHVEEVVAGGHGEQPCGTKEVYESFHVSVIK